jgi:inorganic triphosphatase YgiF
MSNEIELKLEVAPGATEQLMRQPWIERAPRSSQHQLSVYFDTADSELRKRGYTLRVRSAGDRYIQTVKALKNGAGLFDRGEWEYQIDGPEPDAERLAHTPLAAIDVGALRPVIRSEVNRTACRLKPNGAEIELDVDHGTVTAGGRKLPVHEIEIELLRGSAQSAVEIARRIAGEVPVKLGVMSKAERGFALADGELGKVSKAGPVLVQPGMTVADGFATIVMACLRHFRLNEPLVIEERTAEALHQARVAMRRLRSALSLFRTAVGDADFGRIRDELRWFTGELGDARNLDVYLRRDLPEVEREALETKREHAYDHVVAAMNSHRFRTLMLDLVAWAAIGEWREHPNAERPLEPYVNRRIDRLWHKITAAGDLADMDADERHQLRIGIKKLRYAVEFVEALHTHESQRQKKFGKAVEDLQEALGELNDLVVAHSLERSSAWPILPEEPGEDERRLLSESDHALDRLQKIGPYWRGSKAAEAH